MEPKDRASYLLEEVARLKGKIAPIEQEANEAMEEVAARYGEKLRPYLAELDRADSELKALMKTKTAEVFEGSDKVVLACGILFHTKEFRVSIPRDALEKIEELGWLEGIKVAKSLDRAVIEAWPIERLVEIGAKRRLQSQFGYELTKEPGS